jgi:hypothetical protein
MTLAPGHTDITDKEFCDNTLMFSYKYEKPKSELILCDGLAIRFKAVKPNCWWRMWQYLLLGFKWNDVLE